MASNGAPNSAKVIVAIDFGTTFSGFSLSRAQSGKTHPDQGFLDSVAVYEQWPFEEKAGVRGYFKTQTSLLYMQTDSSKYARDAEYELIGWGWEAFVGYRNLLQKSKNAEILDGKRFHFLTKFKLALAGAHRYGEPYDCILPEGFTAERVIADYLHQLGILVEKELQNRYADEDITKRDIQWCLTVPAMWGEVAKQQMRKCAEIAGLVSGPSNTHGAASPHPIIIVLEPEGASAYCLYYLQKTHQISLPAGSKILIVDAGGGTVDLVFHEKVNPDAHSFQVKEVSEGNSGGLCGATFVDLEFDKLLSQKIPCYEEFKLENPSAALKMRRDWEDIKFGFEGDMSEYVIWAPSPLSKCWQKYNKANGLHDPDFDYGELSFTLEELQLVFDSGAVNSILDLIEEQLAKVPAEDVHALLVVGGFSSSKYLMKHIREKFDRKVKRIINPSFAGKAVVAGAIAYGYLGKEIVTTRIAQKTYGIGVFNGRTASGELRGLKFDIFVRKGDEVGFKTCFANEKLVVSDWCPGKAAELELQVYSTTHTNPKYVTDPGVVQECTYIFEVPAMEDLPKIKISMFFGRTVIEVTADGINFEKETAILPTITFDKI